METENKEYDGYDQEHAQGLLSSGPKRSARRSWASRWRDWRAPIFFTIFGLLVGYVVTHRSAPPPPTPHFSGPGYPGFVSVNHDEEQSSHPVGSSMDSILKPFAPKKPKPAKEDQESAVLSKPVESRPSLHYEAFNSCFAMKPAIITELQQVTEPTVQIVSNGTVIRPGMKIQAPAELCLLISLPQEELPESEYFDLPVPGKGPDVVHAYLNSTSEIITFPPLNPFPTQVEAFQQSTNISLVYYAATRMFTAGTYEVVAEREWSHWRWAQEWSAEWFIDRPPIIHTLTGYNGDNTSIARSYEPLKLPQHSFTVTGTSSYPHHATCDDTLTPGQGRWYSYNHHPELAVDASLVDEFGYTWQGDQCHMDFYSPAEAMDCLQDKVVHFYGDSMIRRLAKAVINGGRWCLDPKARCQDEDDDADIPVPKLEADKDGNLQYSEMPREGHFQQNDITKISFGRNTSMYYAFLTVITNSTGTWMDRLYDEKDLVKLDYGGPDPTVDHDRDVRPGALAREPPDIPNADLVVLGPGAWDQAFTARFDSYEFKLRQLKYAFQHAYTNTPMVLRLSNMFCCRDTTNGRRYNGGRIREFDERARRVFEINAEGSKGSNGRVMLLDPSNMNGRPDIINDLKVSHANHPRASHVRMEFQMMMNSVCKKDPYTGKVSFRPQKRH